MDNIKNDSYYIGKIKDDLSFIVKHTQNIEKNELKVNEILLDSMMFRLIQISENAKKLSDEYKKEHQTIPLNVLVSGDMV